MTRSLTLMYTHTDNLGYGRMGMQMARALRGIGVNVSEDANAHTPAVCHVSYPSHARGWLDGQHTVTNTMWETDTLPESFRESMHEFDTVIVPSEQNRQLFSQYHPNVKVVPLGIDPDRWHYRPRTQPGVYFTYLIGGSGPRKGTDLAFKAFTRVWGKDGSWGDGPIPRLVMKSPRDEGFYHQRVETVAGFISSDDELDLYSQAHCYIQPSRGEGFGLQPLQAMAQGIPTILTNAHGHEAFADYGIGLSAQMVPAGYFMLAGKDGAGHWWEPSLDELCEAMFDVYHRWEQFEHTAAVNSQKVTAEFTWENTARQFCDAIGNDVLSAPYSGSGQWVTPTKRLYRVVTTRDYNAEQAGYTFQWTKGVEYFETADTKRLLFECNVLDPVCLDGDPGYLESEVEQYSAKHSFCRECGQRLGSGVTRADEIEASL